ncbi:MAG: glycosyltransferase family 39 protein [Candidatus Omnitrophica bacterium]|nr:glycosyltransferase family 39 protein [Candidatus Omnitrophota bacterium]
MINYYVDPSRILAADSCDYDNSAKALLYLGKFSVSPDKPDSPQLVRTPGYPFFIALIYAIFGEKYFPVITIQIFLNVLTILLTYLLAKKLWGLRVALLSTILLSLDFTTFTYSQMLLTETLFTFFLLIAVTRGIYLILSNQKYIKNALLLGSFSALATLVRPISYYLIYPILIFFIVARVYCCKIWRKTLFKLFLIILPWIILIGGWQLRNFYVSGSFDFSYIEAVDLLFYRGAEIIAIKDGISRQEAREKIIQSLPKLENWSEAMRYRYFKKEGLSLILQHPFIYTKVMLKSIFLLLIAPADTEFLAYLGIKDRNEKVGPLRDLLRLPLKNYIKKWIAKRTLEFIVFLFAIFYLITLYITATYSLYKISTGQKEQISPTIFIFIIILYFLIISAGPEAGARLRVPLMPFFCLLSARGCVKNKIKNI